MAFAESQIWSSDTLAAGVDTLMAQGIKIEPTADDRDAMEKELQENGLEWSGKLMICKLK